MLNSTSCHMTSFFPACQAECLRDDVFKCDFHCSGMRRFTGAKCPSCSGDMPPERGSVESVPVLGSCRDCLVKRLRRRLLEGRGRAQLAWTFESQKPWNRFL